MQTGPLHARRPSGGSPDSLGGARASGLLAGIFGSGRRGSGRGGGGGNASPSGMKRCASGGGAPTCLICLEYLTPEDFEARAHALPITPPSRPLPLSAVSLSLLYFPHDIMLRNFIGPAGHHQECCVRG